MFSGRSFGEICVECAEGKELMCGGPAIPNDGGIIPGNLEGISTVWINCPELPISQERNFVASYMPGTTRRHAGKQEQHKYKKPLMFHEKSIVLLSTCVKRKLLTACLPIFYATVSIIIT